MNLSEKKKRVPKGKRLNPIKIKHRAELLFGSGFRRALHEELTKRGNDCSAARISQALSEKGNEVAPFILSEINTIIKESETNFNKSNT